MTISQRKNSSGSKGLHFYNQIIDPSNETLLLKNNMETDSHFFIDINKSDEDKLLSKSNTITSSDESLHNKSTSFRVSHHSSINGNDDTIDLHIDKPNIDEQTVNSKNIIHVHGDAKPRVVTSAIKSSQYNINNNTSYSSNNKHRSYTNSNNGNYSSHSSLYNLPSYTVTNINTTSAPPYYTNKAMRNSSGMSSSISSASYNNISLNNNRGDDGEETPLNVTSVIIDDDGHNMANNININNYREIEDDKDENFNSVDMYSSTNNKPNRKQKSIYKRLLNQNSEQYQEEEDYLDIKREDTQIIHDIFKKSICNNFTLQFKDSYNEINYTRYINNKSIECWKKSIIILAAVLLISQFIVLISVKGKSTQLVHLCSIVLLDIFGLVIPVLIFYYFLYQVRFRTLTKIMSYLLNAVLFCMGPVTILGTNIIINDKNPDCDILLLAYISFFFVGHYFLFYNYIPGMFSIGIYCLSWIISVYLQNMNSIDVGIYPFLKIALFCLISVIMVYSLYKKERTTRRQFLNEQRLMRINSKLKSQLNRIERGFANEAADLDAPIEKAISTVRSLMASPTIGPEHLKALSLVLCYLQVPNLFAPDLDQQVNQGLKMDDEREKWLFSEVAHRKQIERSKRSSSSESSSHTGTFSPFYDPSSTIQEASMEPQIINIDNFLTNHSAELLTSINDYNFPMFEYFKSTSRPLLTMAYHIFVKSGLLGRLNLSVNQFLNFMSSVEDGYHPEHQFHNAEHASDVLHCIYYFSTIPNIAGCFKDLDYLAMYIAACIHDYDHPGVSNKFLVSVGDPLAQLYNDKSVLENHHCSAALKLLNKPGCNFLDRLEKEKKRELRETIIELVLATDLSNHFSYKTSFKQKLLDTMTCNTREDRLLLMQMLIKCCDVSNPTKSRNIYKGWISRVMSEFFSQGDREKQLNMTVSAFCNRDNANVYSCQKGFIDFVVAPIFEAVGDFISKFEPTRRSSLSQLQRSSTINNTLSRENSVHVNNSNDHSIVSLGSGTDNERPKVTIATPTNDEANTSTLLRQKNTSS